MSTAEQLRNTGDLDTSYAQAWQEWDDRIGSARVQARNWRVVALLAVLGMLVSLWGLIYLGAQPKRVPYFVEIDRLGQASFPGNLGRNTFSPNEMQLKFHLERFVRAVRSVSQDQAINEANIHDAYAMLTARGGTMLHAYLKGGGDPVKLAPTETRSVEIVSDVQVSDGVYQVDWRQKHWDPTGKLTRDALWRGMFQVQIRPASDVADIRKNPIGLFIDELHCDCVGDGCAGDRRAQP